MKKPLSLLTTVALSLLGLMPATPASAAGVDFVPRYFSEIRPLTVGTAFSPESDDFHLEARATLSIAQAALTGATTDVYRINAELKSGTTVVAVEQNLYFSSSFFYNESGANVANPKFATASGSQIANFSLVANMIQGASYTIDVELTKNGTALVQGTDYTISSLTGDFSVLGTSIVPTGEESSFEVRGDVCVPAANLSSLAVGDQLELTVSDTSGRSYNVWNAYWTNGGSYSSRSNSTVTLEAADLVTGLSVWFDADISASGAAAYDPKVSIKKVGGTTELAADCLTPPSAAPTLTASATGLVMQVSMPAGMTSAQCYIAHVDNPNLVVEESVTDYGMFGPSMSANDTCSFFGLKQGQYVGWYTLRGYFYEAPDGSSYQDLTAYSAPSPKSAAVAYAGGNAAFPTYTGTTAGSGQGSLQVATVANQYFDFRTSGGRFSSSGYGRSSDGSGGLLIASIEGPMDELSLRRLTSSGQDMTFAGDGTAEVSIMPVGRATRAPNVGWFGPGQDKWVLLQYPMYNDQAFGSGASTYEIITGDYTAGEQGRTVIGAGDLGAFCANAFEDASNRENSYSGSINRLLSLPSTQPTLIIECRTERRISNNYYYSSIPFLAALDGSGDLVLKNRLAAEPTDAEPCSLSMVSGANSGATGSDVMVASYQVTWLPSGSQQYYGCSQSELRQDPSLVVSRDVYKVLANTQTVTVAPVTDVMTNTGSTEPLVSMYGGYESGSGLIVSGSNVFFLGSETTGSYPNINRTFKVALLDQSGSFGEYTTMPALSVAGETGFSEFTTFSQIPDFSENDATTVLLLRTDAGGTDSGVTATRVTLADGTAVSYRQMVASSSGTDGFFTAVGNSSGDLNFFGISSRTEAVVGQWVTSGALDPELAALPVNQGAANTGVSAPSAGPGPNPGPGPSPSAPTVAPFDGPTIKTVGVSLKAGEKGALSGENLDGVSKISIGDTEVEFEISADGELMLDLPADLPGGVYSLTVEYEGGTLTLQNALTVTSADPLSSTGEARPSTKRGDDDTVKVRVFDVVNAGKVQIFVNDREVVWIRATDFDDPRLTAFGYLVRTIVLQPGKNVIEVYVDGNRVDRKAYTKVEDDDSKV